MAGVRTPLFQALYPDVPVAFILVEGSRNITQQLIGRSVRIHAWFIQLQARWSHLQALLDPGSPVVGALLSASA